MAKQLLFSDAARRKILEGVDILAHAVGTTLGPTGRNVILSKSFGGPTVTKDGVTVSKEIELADPFENMGAKLVNVVASKTSDVAGDGTTTATILARAIYREGLKNITSGANPTAVRRGIEKAVEAAVAELAKISRPVSKKEEIAQVGTISANNDPEIGKMLADAVERVGRDGVITVEEGKTADTVLEFVEGMQFDKGYLSPYFVTSPTTMEVIFEDALILLHEKKISSLREMVPLAREGRPVGQAALDHRRGRRGRSPGDPGGQQAARRAQHLRGQGAGVRRSPQGDAGRHRRGHRRHRDQRRPGAQARKPHAGPARQGQADQGQQGQHDLDPGGRQEGRHPAPDRPASPPDPGDRERVRQGEVPGTARQALRRRGLDSRGCAHRGRHEANQGAHRRRPARDAGGGRGRNRAGRRRGPACGSLRPCRRCTTP